jgi:glycosyltransferase involved in cell wall biosynthesis
VNAGRISPLKGQDQLLEALPAIIRYYPNLLCIFAGQLGSDTGLENTNDFFQTIQKRIQELGLGTHVLFVGEIDYLPSLLRRGDLYVHTSRMESFCRTVAEALVCGTPVVAFDSGAVPEVAGPGALLVTSGDTAAFSAAVIDLLAQEERRSLLVEKGRRHIETCYGAERAARIFTDVLKQEFLGKRGAEVKKCAV